MTENKNKKTKLLYIWRFLKYIAVGYFAAAFVIVSFQRQLLYHPFEQMLYDPDKMGLEVVSYVTSQNRQIETWYCPAQSEDFPTFVFFHGNAGNVSYSAREQVFFCSHGYGFLGAEYSGFYDRAYKNTEESIYNDARAAIEWLRAVHAVPEQNLILYGESLGTGVASQMALEYKQAKAVILKSPFTNIPEVANHQMPHLRPFTGLILDRYDTLSRAAHIRQPVLVVHGDRDTVVPIHLGKKAFQALGASEKKFSTLKGGNHNDLVDFGLLPEIKGFVEGL